MISVILAGGKGIRLWPESRQEKPKQFCRLVDDRSMLDHTIDRCINTGFNRIVIITSDDLLPHVQQLVQQRPDNSIIEILSEPEGKNTAPAVGLALARYQAEPDEIIAVFPSDHHILDNDGFGNTISKAVQAANNNHIAIVGVMPNRPETGYGYIEKSRWEVSEIPDVFQVSSFREKPDLPTAESYLAAGNYMWNAGIYIGKTSIFMEEFMKHIPQLYEPIAQGYEPYRDAYALLPSISLDYGIAEKSDRMAVVSGDFGWCDLGSWNALAELHQQDERQNICAGQDVVILDSNNCLVKQTEKTIVLFGVDNLLVVETGDVILISERQRCQDVRSLVEALNREQRFDLL
ncbi:MAG TPA: mannose-1-phosphate guanylyltransferase [Syntrophomonas sp.]|mgnify:CR=1 FL=1|jgi:mannose-1-phosphate guanylyltransferase/mannose-6-phosphate isomerase|nr:mannose-1-phosphate guanylyltransferase [Syntrophomonas sp.]HCF71053.1 mannose-1-phosphate guanylyltransferase [Syntrophomonas sp.]